MIKVIFWDNDGVLVDTEHLYFQATRQTLASVGVDLDVAAYAEFLLKQSRGAWHLAAARGVSEADIERLRVARNTRYSQLLHDSAAPMPGAAQALLALSERYTMGVVTSSHREHFDIIHQRTGFRRYFNFVLTREDYLHAKPEPEPYLRALEHVGCPPEACLVIEDSERGLIAAKAAGLTCWVIPTALSASSDFSAADKVLDNLGQVVSALLGVPSPPLAHGVWALPYPELRGNHPRVHDRCHHFTGS